MADCQWQQSKTFIRKNHLQINDTLKICLIDFNLEIKSSFKKQIYQNLK